MKKYITPQQLSEIVGVSKPTIIAWVKKYNFECTKTLGGHIRFSEKQVAKILKKYNFKEEEV